MSDSLIDSVASAMWDATPTHCGMTFKEAADMSKFGSGDYAQVVRDYRLMAKAAIAAMGASGVLTSDHKQPDDAPIQNKALPEASASNHKFDTSDYVHINDGIKRTSEICNNKTYTIPGYFIRFLCGEEAINGAWYGDKVDGKPYWWRSFLRKEIGNIEPVTIKDAMQAYYDVDLEQYDSPEAYDEACVKSVLDAAGVKYVD